MKEKKQRRRNPVVIDNDKGVWLKKTKDLRISFFFSPSQISDKDTWKNKKKSLPRASSFKQWK